jgi:DHA2 family methylenomycin A resistance protein-like MFS transporter
LLVLPQGDEIAAPVSARFWGIQSMTDAATTLAPVERSYWGVIALIALGQVILAIDFCVSSIGLASIGRDLTAGPATLSWVVTVFSLTYGGFLILGGRVADLFGHRRACILGLILFGGGSLLAASSTSIQMLIAVRAIEGLGGALLTPTSFSLINVMLPDGPIRHRAYSVFGVTQGLSYILGLYVGGALVTHFGWRSGFLLNVPAIIIAIVLAWRQIPLPDPNAARSKVDIAGAILITAGMGLLMFALSSAGRHGLVSLEALVPLVLGISAIVALIVVESNIEHPLVSLSVFRYPNLAGADLACIAMIAAGSSVFVLLPLFLQRTFHFTPEISGLAMLPYCAAVVAGGQVVGLAMSRFTLGQCAGGGIILFVGATLTFCLGWGGTGNFEFIMLPAMIVAAFGATAASLAIMALSTGQVAAKDQGLASAVLMTCQQIGVSLGVSIVFAVIATASLDGSAVTVAFHHAFIASATFAALALVSTVVLTRSPKNATAPIRSH